MASFDLLEYHKMIDDIMSLGDMIAGILV